MYICVCLHVCKLLVRWFLYICCKLIRQKHRRRLWGGQPGHAPPNNQDGGKPLFCPPIIRREFVNFVYLKKINMKESRNRDNNINKTDYMTKKGRQKFWRE